jgi:glucose/arabinose dehydrogenase/azurin
MSHVSLTGWAGLKARTTAFLCIALFPISGLAQERLEPNRGGVVDLSSRDPRIALERIRVAPGYEVNLFASEEQFPEVGKPLAMTFDARGRLWVLTSPTYPHALPGKKPNDKLVILEDLDGDGRADKSTVFADDLYVPMGFELGDGGVYVSQQPTLVFLRDTNGDDRADERRVLLHGFGSEDSHHSMHAFTWGPGGGLYFQEGTFHHSQVETPYGPVRVENAAVFRYEPRDEHLSVFASYSYANPWGHVIDRWGQNFISDASNGYNHFGTAYSGHVDYPRKQRPIKEWTNTRVRPTAGIEFVSSRHFPDDAQGNFLINNTIGFLGTKQYRVVEDGSGFSGIEVEPLLQSSDPNFRPVALQFGPDGALYIVDWFNPLIGHMQYSIRDPGRDKTRGRVWRVTAKGRPLLERPKIYGQPVEAQLELLKAYEDRTRYWTRRALRERRREDVVPALRSWVGRLDPSDKDYEHHLLEGLWVFQHHDVVEVDLLKRLLQAKEFRARAAAVRVLQLWFDRVDGALSLLEQAVNDPAPRVRLEAVRALSFVPRAEAAGIAVQALKHETDYYLDYTLDSTITTLESVWKPALTSGRRLAEDNPTGLAYLLERMSEKELTALPRSATVSHELLRRPGIDRAARVEALAGLAASNGRSVVEELLDAVARVDGAPGGAQTAAELLSLMGSDPFVPGVLGRRGQTPFGKLEQLALTGRTAAAREGAWAAFVRVGGGFEETWRSAATSPRSQLDLLNGLTAQALDEATARALYPRVAALIDRPSPAASAPAVKGRYVRILLPGRDRVLGLAEVAVKVEGTTLAGQATQSTYVPGGDLGGFPNRAIDDVIDRKERGKTSSFTTQENDPWWELDLGADRPIESIAIHPFVAEGRASLGGLHVSVLDETREAVFVADGLQTTADSHLLQLGGDLSAALRDSAIRALGTIPGHDDEVVQKLATLLGDESTRAAATLALTRIAPERWPSNQVSTLADRLLAYATAFPAAERTSAEFRQAVALGRSAATRLGGAEGPRVAAALDALAVRTVRITALLAQMKFDVDRFAVAPGEEVEIVLVNADHMPHNLLLTRPGALEDVALKAEAMASQPDAFQKHFVPESADILQATPLINHEEIARLRFTAPTSSGDYPFVCTFPGHWRTMNGVMEVK